MSQRVRRPSVAVGALALGAFCATGLGSAAGAGTPDAAEELLAKARTIATVESFAGVVEVLWIDDDGVEQVERVAARGADGAFVIGVGARKAVGDKDERFTTSGDGHTRWKGDGGTRAPRPGESWDLEVAGRRQVAGRAAVVVTAHDDNGRVRAKFAIDRETGQLLRRAVLDEDGDVIRVLRFVTIITGGVDAPAPAMPSGDQNHAPVAIQELPSGFVARADVGAGYRLLGQYLQPDGAVQLYYSDGLFTASVFQRSGRLDWDALPPGTPAAIDGVRARSYATPTGTLVVWGDRDVVLTAVGDGPPDAVIGIVAEMSGNPSDDQSWFDHVTDFVFGPFDWE